MGMLQSLFRPKGPLDAPDVTAAIERAIDGVEPRLRHASGYPNRYRQSVAHALEYARDLVTRLPGPVDVSRESFARDPLVHALFPSVDEIRAAMCISKAMRDFRQTSPAATEVFCLMGMRRREKGLLGFEMAGETLRRDVPQRVVYFTDHTMTCPAESEIDVRERIALSFFDCLVGHAASRIVNRKGDRETLENARDEVLARLHGAPPGARGELEKQLGDILKQLQQITEQLDFRHYAADFDAVLLNPERHLYLETASMKLDGMGICREGDEACSTDLVFSDLIGWERRRWTVTLVHCSHFADATMAGRLEAGERWLGP